MSISEFDFIVCDTEVFAHDWLVVFRLSDGEFVHFDSATSTGNDVLAFLNEHSECVIVTFNGKHYDKWILQAITSDFEPEEVKEVNDFIIETGQHGWEHPYFQDEEAPRLYFHHVDLKDDMDQGLSLKAIEAHLGYPIVESSVPFDYPDKLNKEQRDEVLFYCKNDVARTSDLLKLREPYIQTKLDIADRFGIDPYKAISLTNAKLTALALGAKPQTHDDERAYEIPDELLVEYIPAEVLSFFGQLKDESISDEDLWHQKLELEVGGCPVTLGFGGIHGALPKYREEADHVA